MNSKLEEIKNLLAVIAIIVGGIWALYEFDALFKSETAETELAILKKQLEEKPNINIKACVELQQESNIGLLNLSITNQGSAGAILNFNHGPVYIAEYSNLDIKEFTGPTNVNIYEISSYSRSKKLDPTISKVTNLKIDPQEIRNYALLVLFENTSSFYHIEFAAEAKNSSSENQDSLEALGITISKPSLTVIATSLIIKPSSITNKDRL